MTSPVSPTRIVLAWLLAAGLAALLSIGMLAVSAGLRGAPIWAVLNATTHAFYGPEVAAFPSLDLAHTGLGLAIHLASCLFWALVAVGLARLLHTAGSNGSWIAGLITATLAAFVDYGLMPSRLTPGWELVLPRVGVATGLVALGVGLALGLIFALPTVPPHLTERL